MKFQEDLPKVIDREIYNSTEALKQLFPEKWILFLLVLNGIIEIEGSSKILLHANEVAIILPDFKIVMVSRGLTISALCFSSKFAEVKTIYTLGRGRLRYIFADSSCQIKLKSKEAYRLANNIEATKRDILQVKIRPFGEELLQLWFNLLLYEFISLYSEQFPIEVQISGRNEKVFADFLNAVRQHCRKEHGVKFYAGKLFVTTGHLGKVVRAVSSHSAKYFIEMAIIAEAYVLLADPMLSMADIADELHFPNISSFSNFFKRYAKVSPSLYRKAL